MSTKACVRLAATLWARSPRSAAPATADLGERAQSVAASRTHAFVLTNDGVLCYGLDGAFAGTVITEKKPLTVVAAKKPLMLTQGQASELDPPGET